MEEEEQGKEVQEEREEESFSMTELMALETHRHHEELGPNPFVSAASVVLRSPQRFGSLASSSSHAELRLAHGAAAAAAAAEAQSRDVGALLRFCFEEDSFRMQEQEQSKEGDTLQWRGILHDESDCRTSDDGGMALDIVVIVVVFVVGEACRPFVVVVGFWQCPRFDDP